jgi:3-deoxy-D-manno-octulosonic-acid transferase
VLPQHTGWPLLQDRFHVQDFPGATITHHQATTNYCGVASKLTGQAAAAVVAPVEQQLQVVQQLRAASPTLFIVCWCVLA